MLTVPAEVQAWFDARLEASVEIARQEWPDYRKWLRFYLDLCGKYGFDADAKEGLPRFQEKLASKGQSPARRAQAGSAVGLYCEWVATRQMRSGSNAPGGRGSIPGPDEARPRMAPGQASASDAVAQAKPGPTQAPRAPEAQPARPAARARRLAAEAREPARCHDALKCAM